MKVFRRRYRCGTLHCLVPFFPFNLVTVFVWSNLALNGFFKNVSASLTGVPLEKKGHPRVYSLLELSLLHTCKLLLLVVDYQSCYYLLIHYWGIEPGEGIELSSPWQTLC